MQVYAFIYIHTYIFVCKTFNFNNCDCKLVLSVISLRDSIIVCAVYSKYHNEILRDVLGLFSFRVVSSRHYSAEFVLRWFDHSNAIFEDLNCKVSIHRFQANLRQPYIAPAVTICNTELYYDESSLVERCAFIGDPVANSRIMISMASLPFHRKMYELYRALWTWCQASLQIVQVVVHCINWKCGSLFRMEISLVLSFPRI